ncbi:hypothetical protein KDW41_24090 [Burkholderia vietnamiensis]|nr:hypothetical protein [Burkholderia vietnamiensis]
MPVEAQAVNWWIVGFSSAVVAALVNNGISLWTRLRDRKRADAELAARKAHIQLDVALMLEKFAQRASAHLITIDAAYGELYRRSNRAPLERLDSLEFDFEVAPEPSWSELSIELIAKVREIPIALKESGRWISIAFSADDADYLYQLEAQRAAYYGLQACNLANAIRQNIGVAPSAMAAEHILHFRGNLEGIKHAYVGNALPPVVIPELYSMLHSETLPAAVQEVSGAVMRSTFKKGPQRTWLAIDNWPAEGRLTYHVAIAMLLVLLVGVAEHWGESLRAAARHGESAVIHLRASIRAFLGYSDAFSWLEHTATGLGSAIVGFGVLQLVYAVAIYRRGRNDTPSPIWRSIRAGFLAASLGYGMGSVMYPGTRLLSGAIVAIAVFALISFPKWRERIAFTTPGRFTCIAGAIAWILGDVFWKVYHAPIVHEAPAVVATHLGLGCAALALASWGLGAIARRTAWLKPTLAVEDI